MKYYVPKNVIENCLKMHDDILQLFIFFIFQYLINFDSGS